MFCNLAKLIFEYFCDNRRILATFAKFFSNRFSQIIPLPESQARFPVRVHACLFLRQFDTTNLYKIPCDPLGNAQRNVL